MDGRERSRSICSVKRIDSASLEKRDQIVDCMISRKAIAGLRQSEPGILFVGAISHQLEKPWRSSRLAVHWQRDHWPAYIL